MIYVNWLLVILFLNSPNERLSVDEVGGRRILSGAVSADHGLVLIAVDGMPPTPELYHYEFATQTFLKVDDGRLPTTSFIVLPQPDGFLLWEKSAFRPPALYFLDQHGGFQKSQKLTGFDGFEADIAINAVSPYGHGRYLVTYQKGIETPQRNFLAMVDLKEKTWDMVQTFEGQSHEPLPFWTTNHTSVFLVFPFTGRVDLVHRETFAIERNLLKGAALVPSRQGNKLPKGMARKPAFLKFKPMINAILYNGAHTLLAYTEFLEGEKEVSMMGYKRMIQNRKERALRLDKISALFQDHLMLEHATGSRLIFMAEEGTFFAEPNQIKTEQTH